MSAKHPPAETEPASARGARAGLLAALGAVVVLVLSVMASESLLAVVAAAWQASGAIGGT